VGSGRGSGRGAGGGGGREAGEGAGGEVLGGCLAPAGFGAATPGLGGANFHRVRVFILDGQWSDGVRTLSKVWKGHASALMVPHCASLFGLHGRRYPSTHRQEVTATQGSCLASIPVALEGLDYVPSSRAPPGSQRNFRLRPGRAPVVHNRDIADRPSVVRMGANVAQ